MLRAPRIEGKLHSFSGRWGSKWINFVNIWDVLPSTPLFLAYLKKIFSLPLPFIPLLSTQHSGCPPRRRWGAERDIGEPRGKPVSEFGQREEGCPSPKTLLQIHSFLCSSKQVSHCVKLGLGARVKPRTRGNPCQNFRLWKSCQSLLKACGIKLFRTSNLSPAGW